MYRLRFNIGLMRWPGMQACILGLLPVAGLLLLSTAALARMADAPAFVAPADEPIPDGSRVDVVADRLTYDQKTDVATATGTVQLTYGPYVLTASDRSNLSVTRSFVSASNERMTFFANNQLSLWQVCPT